MSGLFERLKGGRNRSADKAKERLRFVLIHDRTDLAPAALNSLKNELIEVISRYVEINPDLVNIDITQEGREQRLVADIPIVPSGRGRKR